MHPCILRYNSQIFNFTCSSPKFKKRSYEPIQVLPKYYNIPWLINDYTMWHTNNSSKYRLVAHSLKKKQCWGGGENWIKKIKPKSFWFINIVFQHQLFCLHSIHCYTCLLAYAPSGCEGASASLCSRLYTCRWALHAYSKLRTDNRISDTTYVYDYTYCSYSSSSLKFCEKAEK